MKSEWNNLTDRQTDRQTESNNIFLFTDRYRTYSALRLNEGGVRPFLRCVYREEESVESKYQ